MNKYFVISILKLVAICVVSGQSSGLTEWPVYFEHLGLVHSIHNKWDLSLSTSLHLPKLEAKILKTIHRLRLLSGKYDKEAATHFRSVEEKSRFEELQESWSKLNRQLSRRAENMRRRTKNLKYIGGSFDENHRIVKSRKTPGGSFDENGHRIVKRQTPEDIVNEVDAVIQLTGGVLQSLFSVAYTDDVRKVVSRIDKIDDDLKKDITVVKTDQTSLKKRTVDSLTKQEGKMKMVEKMARTVERKVADMETNPYLKTELGNIVRSRSELYQNLQLELNLMEERLGEIERVVISLGNGRLNKNLLSPSKLRETLKNIEKQLPSNYSLLFRSNEALWPYYSLLSVVTTFEAHMEAVVVRLSIPLVDYNNVLDLTKVHNLPLKAKDGYSVKVDINAEYLVTDSSRNHFLELHKEDFADCQVYHTGGDRHFYCGLPPLLDATTTRSCVMQLYQGRSSSEWCQSKLIYGMVQPFSRLYNGSWVFSAISENVQVTLQCPDGNIPTSLMGFGIVGLAEGCTISNEEFWYPHTFAGAMQLNLSFGDKGWESTEFHTDLAEGQEDFVEFPDHEYSDELAAVANDDKAIIIEDPTARSVNPDLTTTLSSTESEDDINSQSSSTSTTLDSTSTEGVSESPDIPVTPIFQLLNVQDPPDGKETEIHNDILVKLKEQLRGFFSETAAAGR